MPAKQLRRTCDPRTLKFKTTADLTPLEGTVGQDRAVSALDFGLNIEADGFNVFVAGPTGNRSLDRGQDRNSRASRRARLRRGTGATSSISSDPAVPTRSASRPTGAISSATTSTKLVMSVRAEVPRAFESDEYIQRRDQVAREVQAQREQFFEALENEAAPAGLAVNVTPMGITTAPLVDGKPITKEQYEALTDERKHEIQEHTAELDSIIAQMAPQLRRLDRGAHLLLQQLDKQVMVAIASPRIEELKRDYQR